MPHRSWLHHRPPGLRSAQAALIVGGAFTAFSVYWGLGGTWLLDTVSGSLAKGRVGDAALIAVWAAAALKTIAAVLPVAAVGRLGRPAWNRNLRALAWAEAAGLTVYGLAQTVANLLVQIGIIPASANADHRALAWHAYLWDPWFLIWGLLVVIALRRSRDR